VIGRRVSCPLFGSGESGKQGLYSRYEEGEDLIKVDVSPALGPTIIDRGAFDGCGAGDPGQDMSFYEKETT
jgi:hypothetical protein